MLSKKIKYPGDIQSKKMKNYAILLLEKTIESGFTIL